MGSIVPLSRSYSVRGGAPHVDRVDTDIFRLQYFAACMDCSFCHDVCCQFGVDVDEANVERLLAIADRLEPVVGYPRSQWFTDAPKGDPDFPSGAYRRTRVVDGACVFRARTARGCLIHSFAIAEGVDFHDIKPLVSALFPLTFDGGLLKGSTEAVDRSLACSGPGPTLYRGARGDAAHYFGPALIAELDAIEAAAAQEPRRAAG